MGVGIKIISFNTFNTKTSFRVSLLTYCRIWRKAFTWNLVEGITRIAWGTVSAESIEFLTKVTDHYTVIINVVVSSFNTLHTDPRKLTGTVFKSSSCCITSLTNSIFQGVPTIAGSTNDPLVVKLFAIRVYLNTNSLLEIISFWAFVTNTLWVEGFAVCIVGGFTFIINTFIVSQAKTWITFHTKFHWEVESFTERVDLLTNIIFIEVESSWAFNTSVVLECFAIDINSSFRFNHTGKVLEFPAWIALLTFSISFVKLFTVWAHSNTNSFLVHVVVPGASYANWLIILGTTFHCAFRRGYLTGMIDQIIAWIAFLAK